MEIVNFFEKLGGRWFSQRTTHFLGAGTSKAGKSELEIDVLDAAHDTVKAICAKAGVDAAEALCGLAIAQTSTIEGSAAQRLKTTVIVPLRPTDGRGEMLGDRRAAYQFENDVLTLTSADDKARSQERWWFITDNLRMRTQRVQPQGGTELASFCSEIRLGVNKPA